MDGYQIRKKKCSRGIDGTFMDQTVGAFQTLLGSQKWVRLSSLKIMAAQIIPQYTQYFPDLQEAAFNAQLVLPT